MHTRIIHPALARRAKSAYLNANSNQSAARDDDQVNATNREHLLGGLVATMGASNIYKTARAVSLIDHLKITLARERWS
jgi:hypothetical protein